MKLTKAVTKNESLKGKKSGQTRRKGRTGGRGTGIRSKQACSGNSYKRKKKLTMKFKIRCGKTEIERVTFLSA